MWPFLNLSPRFVFFAQAAAKLSIAAGGPPPPKIINEHRPSHVGYECDPPSTCLLLLLRGQPYRMFWLAGRGGAAPTSGIAGSNDTIFILFYFILVLCFSTLLFGCELEEVKIRCAVKFEQ
ncbi:hypothetical protein CRV24_002825 [Beauveria bassiana]|nr:hypothetical protein CRV24_002825 [Beauveria bassiana]